MAENRAVNAKRFGQLEALRGFAALYVVAHHLWVELTPNLETSPLRFFLKHGMLAVMVFFVLSGFVIEYTTARGSVTDFKLYFRKRFARIYPLFVMALLLSYVINSIRSGHLLTLEVRNLMGNLLMLQGSPVATGRWFDAYGGNGPLWSLTYEWWFYMMYFPIRKRIPEQYQALFVAGLSTLGLMTNYFIEPNQISMILTLFVIWWLGVEIARGRLRDGKTFFKHVQTPLLGCVGLTVGLQLLVMKTRDSALLNIAHYQLTSFSYLLVIVALGLSWQKIRFVGFQSIFGRFERLAPISYSIYIFHSPILMSGSKLFPHAPPLLVYASLLVVLIAFCSLVEGPLQKRITRILVPTRAPQIAPAGEMEIATASIGEERGKAAISGE